MRNVKTRSSVPSAPLVRDTMASVVVDCGMVSPTGRAEGTEERVLTLRDVMTARRLGSDESASVVVDCGMVSLMVEHDRHRGASSIPMREYEARATGSRHARRCLRARLRHEGSLMPQSTTTDADSSIPITSFSSRNVKTRSSVPIAAPPRGIPCRKLDHRRVGVSSWSIAAWYPSWWSRRHRGRSSVPSAPP